MWSTYTSHRANSWITHDMNFVELQLVCSWAVLLMLLLLLSWCFAALRHILGHFGRGQLTRPHCSWASLLGSLRVLSAHSSASSWQLLILNQRKGENGRRNIFMTKSQRKNVCIPGGRASSYRARLVLMRHCSNPLGVLFIRNNPKWAHWSLGTRKYNLHYDEVRGDILGSPHMHLTPDAVKISSFGSKEIRQDM